MTTLILIVLAGLIGIAGHWLTRWTQGRTESTFVEYLKCNMANTMQSLFANLAASFTIYASTPEDIAGKALVMVLIGSYMAGYNLDSTLNRDKAPEVLPKPVAKKTKIEEIVDEDSNEDLNGLIAGTKRK